MPAFLLNGPEMDVDSLDFLANKGLEQAPLALRLHHSAAIGCRKRSGGRDAGLRR